MEEQPIRPTTPGGDAGSAFMTTRWTLVLAAGRESTPDAARALGELCQSYWYPLYAYVRRRGRSREDAEDLVQGFFERLLEHNPFAGLDASRGRFRAFLLASLKHYMANEWDRSRRLKRGGGVAPLSLDWTDAEDRFREEPVAPEDPERSFDRAWALALLERVLGRLRGECNEGGRGALFEAARGALMAGGNADSTDDAGHRLSLEPGAWRVAVHRLRKRYRVLLRDEIARTLADPAQVEDELRSLLRALQD